MSAYAAICSNVLFPLHERLKGHDSAALRRRLESSQWLSASELHELQSEKLRLFLSAVARNVPYYRRCLDAHGFDPATVASADDLRRLPFLTKALIRENVDSLKSRTAGKLTRYNTGGSSGEPLVFYMGPDRISHDVAAKWRATRWWGVDIGDTEAVLWGSPIELGRQDRIKQIRDRIFRTHLLPAFNMSPAQMDRYVDRIRQIRPAMVFGYASAVALLARHAEQRQRPLSDLGVRVVFVTGETLYPDQRVVIERVFGAPAANGYGSRDAGFIAHQCPHGSLHLSAEHIIVELLDQAGRPVTPGDAGEIVTTHLATADFPFIRYRTGDMAVMATERCKCGRGLPFLKNVMGRTTDFIRTASGNAMHALALIYEVRDKPGVQAFKFVQSKDLSVELLLVADSALTGEIEQEILRGVIRRMGPGTVFKIRRVDEISPERSGKFRYVVSEAPGARVVPASDDSTAGSGARCP